MAQQSEAPGLSTFDAVWRIVNEQHFDPEFNGVDWSAMRNKYRPQAVAAADVKSARKIVGEMLGTLGQSHFALVPRESLGDGEKRPKASPAGTVGFDIRYRDGLVLVSRVEPKSPAAAAGVRTGWALTEIDGVELGEILKQSQKKPALRESTATRAALRLKIDGEVGTRARYQFVKHGGEQAPVVELELERVARDAVPFDMPGLPRFYLSYRSERIEHDGRTIGLLHFSNWFRGISKQIDKALFEMRDCDGVILDLRGNSGGDASVGNDVAGHFFGKSTSIGTSQMRRGKFGHTAQPRRRFNGKQVGHIKAPLVILADETSGSCSEVFTGGMQSVGRARVIGERSAGAALPGMLTKLPNGDYLLHAIAEFKTAKGEALEVSGVKPDQVVPLRRADLLAGRDAVRDAALQWISDQTAR